MGIVIKKIGNRSYAYLVNRQGDKVVHKYLGSTNNPRVKRMISTQEETTSVPERFGIFFWGTHLNSIRLKKNARYIIERILELGNLDALNWLQRVYTVQNILNVLDTSRTVSEKSRIFWRLWFGVNDA